MKLTSEQKAAVIHDGHAVLVACPGSGKTRAIIARLLRCVDKVRDSPRRVACITYTNTAVQEIENRIREFGSSGDDDFCEVSTIHSFCQNNILRHFYWKLPEYKDGFVVLPSDADEYRDIVTEIASEYHIEDYPQQLFESLNRSPNGEPVVPLGIPPDAAKSFWKTLEQRGFIDFCNIVYFSYRLLKTEPNLAANLGARFAYLLIDEFQDTSALQVELMKLINSHEQTQFFLVGDPEQSIYGFAGAERKLMFDFADEIGAATFQLSGNFRCSSPIVELAETIISRQPKMVTAKEEIEVQIEPRYEHCENNFAAITDFFLPTIEELEIDLGNCAILAPNWYQLRPLGKLLREYGIPVVGPGARPYKRRHLFAELAEQVCAYVERPSPELVRNAERVLFFTMQNVTGKADFEVFSHNGRRVLFRLFGEGMRLRNKFGGAKPWLKKAAASFGEILFIEGFLPRESSSLLSESALHMLEDMEKNGVDTANLTLPDLGMFANPKENLKLMTLHAAKGREFGAVGIIALQDGMIPYHKNTNQLTEPKIEEARRLFYVGLTRAERLLMLFTSADDWRPKSRFLDELGFT